MLLARKCVLKGLEIALVLENKSAYRQSLGYIGLDLGCFVVTPPSLTYLFKKSSVISVMYICASCFLVFIYNK